MSEQLLAKASPRRFAKLLQDIGYRGHISEVNGFYLVESGADGHPFQIYFHTEYPDTPEVECSGFQIETAWRNVPLHECAKIIAVCNEFNATMRYTTASLVGVSDEPLLFLKWDQFYPMGLTDEHFKYCINVFISMMGKLYKECKSTSKTTNEDYLIIERHNAALLAAHGPDCNLIEAARLYRMNSELGYAGSLNNLGDLYEKGSGVLESSIAAVHYYTRAAERAEPTAYFSLSSILSKEPANTEILVEALKFAFLALSNLPEGRNMVETKNIIKILTAKLNESDINHARELAQKWKPLFIEKRTMGDSLSLLNDVVSESNSVH